MANQNGNSVTELSASTGGLIALRSGSSYRFNAPIAVSSDGTHVWVANQAGDTVSELSASTGAPVTVLSGSAYGFDDPNAVSSDGTNVWVTNADQSLTGFPG
jgi:DNA-binding beta-propeller fold protein YncE